jgi:hypothetical protein
MIAPDTAHVKFQGSDLSSPQRVFQLLLKRCADLTLQHGFRYFSAVLIRMSNYSAIVGARSLRMTRN